MSQVHVRYEGHSYDISYNDLDVGELSEDDEIRQAVGNYLNAPQGKMELFSVDKNNGEITLRPNASFGVK